MKQPKKTTTLKRCVASSVTRTDSLQRVTDSTIVKINKRYHFAYMAESREADRMFSIFFTKSNK